MVKINGDNIPEQGDILFLDYEKNAIGNEQKGRRPVLVVSDVKLNAYTNLVMVCPITSKGKHYPFQTELSKKQKTIGRVMPEQIKACNFRERKYKYIEKIKKKELAEVLEIIKWIFF